MTDTTRPQPIEIRTRITAERFLNRVGYAPVDDDLDRCNCGKAGHIGHLMCGWDRERDLPRFIAVALNSRRETSNVQS